MQKYCKNMKLQNKIKKISRQILYFQELAVTLHLKYLEYNYQLNAKKILW